jgi:hypothetical protein
MEAGNNNHREHSGHRGMHRECTAEEKELLKSQIVNPCS